MSVAGWRLRARVERERADREARNAERLQVAIREHRDRMARDDWTADEALWAAAGLTAPERPALSFAH